MAQDDWISDRDLLLRITAQQDIHGEWWEIPYQELRDCSLAISYLDSAGVEFYLPAYMTMALDEFTYPTYRCVLGSLDPNSAEADARLREYFRDRLSRRAYAQALALLQPHYSDADDELRENFIGKMSRIEGEKRRVCIRFLEFLRRAFDPLDSRSPFITVNQILKDEHDAIDRVLGHEFWRVPA